METPPDSCALVFYMRPVIIILTGLMGGYIFLTVLAALINNGTMMYYHFVGIAVGLVGIIFQFQDTRRRR